MKDHKNKILIHKLNVKFEKSEDEIKEIFAYLKSVKPVKNIFPQSEPLLTARQGK